MKKILVLYTSHTLGHKVIGENIGYYLEQVGHEVKYVDVLKVQAGRLVAWSANIHRFINRYLPFVWGFLYKSKWITDISLKYRLKVAAKNHLQTLAVVQEFHPDVVIATQVTASGIVAFLKQEKLFTGKFGIAFSDFHLHRYWLYKQADFYLANVIEQKQEMISLGIEPEKIFVCGVILRPQTPVKIIEVKSKFGINPSDKVILMASGSFGFGLNEYLIRQLNQKTNYKIIVVTGKNKKEKQRLEKVFAGTNVIILGFYSPMEELYAVADLFVTKPGGLSVSEALRWRLPMMVVYMLPGQEELNYNYLLGKGLILSESVAATRAIAAELGQGAFKKSLLINPSAEAIAPKPEVLHQALEYGEKH